MLKQHIVSWHTADSYCKILQGHFWS